MSLFIRKSPRADINDIGFVSMMVRESDPRSLRDQLHDGYSHGGGWQPFEGFTLGDNNELLYSDDPPEKVMWELKFRDQLFCVYKHAWFAIIEADGTFEVCRMD